MEINIRLSQVSREVTRRRTIQKVLQSLGMSAVDNFTKVVGLDWIVSIELFDGCLQFRYQWLHHLSLNLNPQIQGRM